MDFGEETIVPAVQRIGPPPGLGFEPKEAKIEPSFVEGGDDPTISEAEIARGGKSTATSGATTCAAVALAVIVVLVFVGLFLAATFAGSGARSLGKKSRKTGQRSASDGAPL